MGEEIQITLPPAESGVLAAMNYCGHTVQVTRASSLDVLVLALIAADSMVVRLACSPARFHPARKADHNALLGRVDGMKVRMNAELIRRASQGGAQ